MSYHCILTLSANGHNLNAGILISICVVIVGCSYSWPTKDKILNTGLWNSFAIGAMERAVIS